VIQVNKKVKNVETRSFTTIGNKSRESGEVTNFQEDEAAARESYA
jgi:hypothetical protein